MNIAMNNAKIAEIEQTAAETLTDFGLCPDENSIKALDIVHIANSLGFSIYNGEMPIDENALVIIQARPVKIFDKNNTGKIIALRHTIGVPGKRFLIAHGLGHFALNHYSKYLPFRHFECAKPDVKNIADSEANYFAAALLMPKEMFTQDYAKLQKSEDRFINLAQKYRVRVSDAKFRAKMLNLT